MCSVIPLSTNSVLNLEICIAWPQKISYWTAQVNKYKQNLEFWILFLCITYTESRKSENGYVDVFVRRVWQLRSNGCTETYSSVFHLDSSMVEVRPNYSYLILMVHVLKLHFIVVCIVYLGNRDISRLNWFSSNSRDKWELLNPKIFLSLWAGPSSHWTKHFGFRCS